MTTKLDQSAMQISRWTYIIFPKKKWNKIVYYDSLSICRIIWEMRGGRIFMFLPNSNDWNIVLMLMLYGCDIFEVYRQHLVHIWLIYGGNSPDIISDIYIWLSFCFCKDQRGCNQGWGLAITLMAIKINQKMGWERSVEKRQIKIQLLPRHTINDEKNQIPSQAHEKKRKSHTLRQNL